MIKKGDRVRSRYNDRFGTVTSVEDWGSGSRYFVRFDKDNDSVEDNTHARYVAMVPMRKLRDNERP